MPPGHSGDGYRQSDCNSRTHGYREGRQDREDREMGPEAHGVSRPEAPRGLLRVYGFQVDPRRSCEGARTPAESFGPGDEVPHRAPGRGIEAAGQTEASPRAPRRAPSA